MAAFLEGFGINGEKNAKTSTTPNTNTQPPTTTGSWFKNTVSSVNKAANTSPFYTWGNTPTETYSSWQAKQAAEKLKSGGTVQGSSGFKMHSSYQAKQAADNLERSGGTTTTPTPTPTPVPPPEPDWSTLPALLPEQQLAYRMAVRDARRDFEMMQNQVQLGRRQARRDFRQNTREINRQQAGGSQDLATALAYLGMDTSPATMGVGLQDIETQSDIARSEVAAMRAQRQAELDMQMTQARIGRNQALSAAEQQRLADRAARATRLERYQMGGQ